MRYVNAEFPPHRSAGDAGQKQDALIVQTNQEQARNNAAAQREAQNTADLMTVGGVKTKEYFGFISGLYEYITI